MIKINGSLVLLSLAEVARGTTPKDIIETLVNTGDFWAQGRPNDDDATFLVLKRS
jgi:hypothetical protein